MVNCINLIIEMSPRFIIGRENVPCVAEVVNRSLKADCTDFTLRLLSVESKTDPKWDRSCLITRDLDRSRSVLGPFLKWTHIVPGKWTTSYRFQEVPCERKASLDPIWDRSQIYPVPCKRGLNFCLHKKKSAKSSV